MPCIQPNLPPPTPFFSPPPSSPPFSFTPLTFTRSQVRAVRWSKGASTLCVVTSDAEGTEVGVIKAAALWNLSASWLTYVYLLFESLWYLGLMGTVDYFRSILFTMESDFSEIYDYMQKQLPEDKQPSVCHLDFIGK